MDEKLTFKRMGIEITGTKERLKELMQYLCFDEDKGEPSNALTDVVSEIETTLGLKDDLPKKIKILEKPYTRQEMKELCDSDGFITGNVAVPLSDIIGNDFEGFLDLLDIKLVDNECLMSISYKAVGITDIESGNADIIIEVTGDVSEIIERDYEGQSEKMKRGYAIVDCDGTGLLEIQTVDEAGIFATDDEATEQAIKDGIKVIPVEELPEKFERRYLGWIDTPENRKAIEEYCRKAE